MTFPAPLPPFRRAPVVAALGSGQILTWGMTYYLPAIITAPVVADTGWTERAAVGAFSLALLTSGLASPYAGRLIQSLSGRLIMALGVALCALGLTVMAVSANLFVYGLAWQIVGLGMAAGLYGPAFSTLGQIFGQDARAAITNVTLFGGFASTLTWPLGSWILQWTDWRGLCLIYAAILVVVVIPLYLAFLPDRPTLARAGRMLALPGRERSKLSAPVPAHRLAFAVLAGNIVLSAFIGATLAVYLIGIMQNLGATVAVAVALGALMGPSQVAARVLERLFATRVHPLWTLLASNLLLIFGLGLMASGLPVLAVSVVVYGAGNGLISIAKGTVPLAMFGAQDYPVLMGRLARPALVTQAAAPVIAATMLDFSGHTGLLQMLMAAALATLPLSGWLLWRAPRGAV